MPAAISHYLLARRVLDDPAFDKSKMCIRDRGGTDEKAMRKVPKAAAKGGQTVIWIGLSLSLIHI